MTAAICLMVREQRLKYLKFHNKHMTRGPKNLFMERVKHGRFIDK